MERKTLRNASTSHAWGCGPGGLWKLSSRKIIRPLKKYDIVSIKVKPARNGSRVESWKPDMTSLQMQDNLPPWKRRRPFVDPYITESMCEVLGAVKTHPPARSLAAVRPVSIQGVDFEAHPGVTTDEQGEINQYVGQIDMFGTDRTALEAPRFRGWYRYKCTTPTCGGHRQGILDREFVALQRRLCDLDGDALKLALRKSSSTRCAPMTKTWRSTLATRPNAIMCSE
ncbi:hypothetical protein [Lentzea albidocapillata]|uniref:hypothetical protein n=1 Tax=Lentzea albidocapillata TaxID=40571 RepID=UPI00115FE3AB|nr:hypothetical protein [Lentzea albidocapillata]